MRRSGAVVYTETTFGPESSSCARERRQSATSQGRSGSRVPAQQNDSLWQVEPFASAATPTELL